MLRINLLPPYVFEKQKKAQIWALWGVIALLVIGVFAWQLSEKNKALGAANEELNTATTLKTATDNNKTKIKGIQDETQQVTDRQTFIVKAQKNNDAWPVLYTEMRDLVSPRVVLRRMAMEARNTVQMAFFVSNEMDAARWWMELRKKDKFDSVKMEFPKHGYPDGTAGGATNAGFRSGMGGMGGMSGMGGMGSGQMMAGMMGGARGGMMGGFGGGGGANSADVGPGEIEGRPGLNMVAHAVLKTPLNNGDPAPSWPAGSGGSGGGGGMSGMMPGMGGMGGMSSMMGGSMGGGGSFGGGGASGGMGGKASGGRAKGGDD